MQITAIQTDRSKSSSFRNFFVFVKGFIASGQPKLKFFLVVLLSFISIGHLVYLYVCLASFTIEKEI